MLCFQIWKNCANCHSQPRFVLNLFLFLAKFQPKCSYKIVLIKERRVYSEMLLKKETESYYNNLVYAQIHYKLFNKLFNKLFYVLNLLSDVHSFQY